MLLSPSPQKNSWPRTQYFFVSPTVLDYLAINPNASSCLWPPYLRKYTKSSTERKVSERRGRTTGIWEQALVVVPTSNLQRTHGPTLCEFTCFHSWEEETRHAASYWVSYRDHTAAGFQQDSTEVPIFTKIERRQPPNLLLVSSVQKFTFLGIVLLYQKETLQTPPAGVPGSQHLTFSPPGTIRTNPIMLLKHGFHKCKKVG